MVRGMTQTLFIDRSRDLAQQAAARVGKQALARRAGVRESTIRNIGDPDWNPTSDTLRKLESAAPAVLAAPVASDPVHERSCAPAHGESNGRNLPKAVA